MKVVVMFIVDSGFWLALPLDVGLRLRITLNIVILFGCILYYCSDIGDMNYQVCHHLTDSR